MDLTSLLFLAGASLVSVSLGVALVIYAQKPPSGTLHRAHNLYDGVTRGAVYIFDGMTMIDATPSAKALLAGSVERGGQWNRLIAFLGQYFTDIESKLLDLSNDGSLVLHADNPEKNFMQIQAEHRGGLLRVCLTDATAIRYICQSTRWYTAQRWKNCHSCADSCQNRPCSDGTKTCKVR